MSRQQNFVEKGVIKKWSHPSDSNRRPFDYESNALPTELGWLLVSRKEINNFRGGLDFQSKIAAKANFRIYVCAAGGVKQCALRQLGLASISRA